MRAAIRTGVALAGMAMMALPSAATAQELEISAATARGREISAELRDLAGDLDRLETRRVELAQAMGETPAARALVRMNEIEDQQRQLTGQVESLQLDIQQMKSKLDRMATDIEYRLGELERRGVGRPGSASNPPPPNPDGPRPGQATSAAAPPPPPPPPPGRAPAASGDPRAQYEAAFDLLKSQPPNYPAAEQALRGFVARNPNHELAGNAQYWLGETFFARGQYQAAAQEFLVGYQKYPKSPKAPDNLLKLAISLSASGKTPEACLALSKFTSDYPQASATLKQRVSLERDKLRCT